MRIVVQTWSKNRKAPLEINISMLHREEMGEPSLLSQILEKKLLFFETKVRSYIGILSKYDLACILMLAHVHVCTRIFICTCAVHVHTYKAKANRRLVENDKQMNGKQCVHKCRLTNVDQR